MIGIEVHQRLNTSKLFCNCKFNANVTEENNIQEDTAHFSRKLRAVAGELGQIDPSAAFEASKKLQFDYFSPEEHSCLIEEDDSPPNSINPEALQIALKICLALKANIVDEIFVMRKTVVDGSAVCGFQRTALIGFNGKINTSCGEVQVQSICLEEESSTILNSKETGKSSFKLDRLGVPLIEIATAPSINDGAHAKETAHEIGNLLRNIGGVQRGIGTIRQDLNISLENGNRVEIKGVQDLQLMPKIVDNELLRQSNLVLLAEKFKKSKVKFSQFPTIVNIIDCFNSHTNCTFAAVAKKTSNTALAIKLDSFSGTLGFELMPDYRFGSELSDQAKVNAQVNGIMHSDEDLSKYSISKQESDAIRSLLNCSAQDAWVACFAPEQTATKALIAVYQRAKNIGNGVEKETRRADGQINRFMRPLPGSSRMYPETDVQPISVSSQELKELEKQLPVSFDQQIKSLINSGVNPQTAEQIVKQGQSNKMLEISKESGASLSDVANLMTQHLTRISREKKINPESVSQSLIINCLKMYSSGKVTKTALPVLLESCIVSNSSDVELIANKFNLNSFSTEQIRSLIKKSKSATPIEIFQSIIREHRLNVDSNELTKLLNIKK